MLGLCHTGLGAPFHRRGYLARFPGRPVHFDRRRRDLTRGGPDTLRRRAVARVALDQRLQRHGYPRCALGRRRAYRRHIA